MSIAYADAQKMVIGPFTSGTTLVSFVGQCMEKSPNAEAFHISIQNKERDCRSDVYQEENGNLICLSVLGGNLFVNYWIVKTPRPQKDG